MYFSKLECLLHILYITSCFPAQNTSLHSAQHGPLLMATNRPETTHHDWQMAIKTRDANHIPKGWREQPQEKAELFHSSVGTHSPGQVAPTRPSAATAMSDLQPSSSHFLHRIHSYLCFSGPGAQGHSDFMPSVKQKSLSSHNKDNS